MVWDLALQFVELCRTLLFYLTVEIITEERRGPGFVRGMQTRGRGVETEAGPE